MLGHINLKLFIKDC